MTTSPSAVELQLREILTKCIMVLDGAMRTMIQRYKLTKKDYRGERFRDFHPQTSEGRELFVKLLKATDIQMQLTESRAMLPASSICGFYFANPQASYFSVGKIDTDQLQDYANRAQITEDEAKSRLATLL